MNPIDSLKFKIQRTLPQVYDDSLSFYELLNVVVEKLNEVITSTNEYFKKDLAAFVGDILLEWYEDGTLQTIINDVVFEDIKDKIEDIAVNVKSFGAIGDGVADDTEAVKAALSYCKQHDRTLLFSGTFKVSGNLTFFNEVYKIGSGKLVDGTDTYYITPRGSQTSILYVGYGGYTTNDGLTQYRPTTMAVARNYIQDIGSKGADGQWRIQFVAGVATDSGLTFYDLPYFRKPLQIWGVYSGGVHQSIWDGSNSTPVYAFRADGYSGVVHIDFKDMKFQNWNKDTSNAGAIVCWEGVNVKTENCYFYNNTIAVWCRGGWSQHYGDYIDGGTSGAWGYGLQYNHSAVIGWVQQPVTIKNCAIGVFLARQSVGHLDYTTLEDNTVCVQLHQKSRIATVGSTFRRWSDRCIWLQGDSIYEDSTSVPSTWDGASISDTTPIFRLTNGSSVPAEHNGGLPYRMAHYVPNSGYTLTGTTEPVGLSLQSGFGSPLRIRKDMLYSAGEFEIEIKMRIDVGGSGGSKKVAVYGAGSSDSYKLCEMTIPASATGGGLGEVTFRICFRANGTGIAKMRYECSNPNLSVNAYATIGSTNFNVTRDKTQDIAGWRIYGTLANAADTMSIYSISSYVYNG